MHSILHSWHLGEVELSKFQVCSWSFHLPTLLKEWILCKFHMRGKKNQTFVFVFPEKQDQYFLVYSQVMNYNTGSGFESALDRRHAYQGTALDWDQCRQERQGSAAGTVWVWMVEVVITISLGEEGFWHIGASKNRAGREEITFLMCVLIMPCKVNPGSWKGSWAQQIWPYDHRVAGERGIRAWVEKLQLPLSRASHTWNSAGTSLQPIILPGLFTEHGSTAHFISAHSSDSQTGLINPQKSPEPQACIGAAYIQIGKLKLKRGCKTPKKGSVAESELEGSCLITKLLKCHNSKKQMSRHWHLPHPIFAKGFYWEKLPECSVLATRAKSGAKKDWLFLSSRLLICFLLPQNE